MKKETIKNASELNVMGDKILIQSIIEKESDGVIKGKTADGKPQQGVVITVGNDVVSDLSHGDVILFNRYSTTKFTLNGIEYHVLREEDVVGYRRD